jgi:hypothetical protein
LILIDSLTSACWEKKERKKTKEKREIARSFFLRARGWTLLAGCAGRDFCGC